jgi:ribosomal protein S15P/S13E
VRADGRTLPHPAAAGLAPEIPEDLYHLIKKAVSVRKHLERNRKDKDSKFRLILVESRIHRLARYYKRAKKLPPTWKYESSTASALGALSLRRLVSAPVTDSWPAPASLSGIRRVSSTTNAAETRCTRARAALVQRASACHSAELPSQHAAARVSTTSATH